MKASGSDWTSRNYSAGLGESLARYARFEPGASARLLVALGRATTAGPTAMTGVSGWAAAASNGRGEPSPPGDTSNGLGSVAPSPGPAAVRWRACPVPGGPGPLLDRPPEWRVARVGFSA
jgi:hypothetical protein